METSASFEARSAPLLYPTSSIQGKNLAKPRSARAFQISIIVDRLDELERYHERIEDFIAEEVTTLRARYAAEPAELTEGERYEREDAYSDEHALLSKTFIRTLRASVLISAYTIFEASLEAMCASEQLRHGHSLTLQDLTGKGVERAKLYLSKVCGVALPVESQEWARLADLNKIRNAFAHADGDVRRLRDPERVRAVVGRTPGLQLWSGTYLEIDREYVVSVIRDIRSVFGLIHKGFPD